MENLPEAVTFLFEGIYRDMQRQSCVFFHALSNGERIFKIGQEIKKLWSLKVFCKGAYRGYTCAKCQVPIFLQP